MREMKWVQAKASAIIVYIYQTISGTIISWHDVTVFFYLQHDFWIQIKSKNYRKKITALAEK